MHSFAEKTAVITGAGSGLGREFALLGAKLGMRLVLADVQQDALKQTEANVIALGAQALSQVCDVRHGDQVEALAQAALERFGAIHLVFNNAGVGAGGLIWESTQQDWEWVLGVNVWGVVHGVRVFTPIMLASERADPSFQGHIVNTASMAGLLTPPAMGIYNVSKHGVVALTETLYHDLSLIDSRLGVSVLCPYFVPTGISHSESVRPSDAKPSAAPTRSQQVSQLMLEKAVSAGKVSAAEVAQITFDAIQARQFYIYSHPQALGNVERRMQDILHAQNPGDPYEQAPKLRDQLRAGLLGD
ncbi:MAG: SDR family oxidoreductase [Betaproteobacteria bacterium]|nr:SDR family oxidoreductase [Betaproteobacteria bacterium]